jgi:protein-arginine kinase activator protein McsA
MRTYKVKSEADFIQKVKDGDVKLASMICNAILTNLDSGKKHVYIVSVEMEEEEEFYDLTCNPEEFIVTLEKNLQVLVDNELYESCQEVVEAIKYLKQKQNSYEKSS